MASGNFNLKDFEGLTPAIDPRRSEKPLVIDGANFVFTADGPRSFFGSEFISYRAFSHPELVYTFRVEETVYLFAQEGVFGYDSDAGDYYPIFTSDFTSEVWPWSAARCGSSYYFARKGVGIVQYNTISGVWSKFANAYLPDDPRWVSQSNGRLLILGSDQVSWSSLDDGTDLEPSLTTGAGFQKTAAFAPGFTYRVDEVTDGFVVCTAGGVMKSQFTDAQYVFRHSTLSDKVKAFSPFGIIHIDDFTVIILTLTGFFITTGDTPQPWQPLISEYIKDKLLPSLDLKILNVLRLDYSIDSELFLFSVGSSSAPNLYFKTFCLYMPVQKWGVFNRIHKGFGELSISQGVNKGINFGYLDENGYLNRFLDIPQVEEADASGYADDFLWLSDFDYPARFESAYWIASSNFHTWPVDPVSYQGLATGRYVLKGMERPEPVVVPDTEAPSMQETNFYVAVLQIAAVDVLSLWAAGRYVPGQQALNSFVEVGLLKYQQQLHADEMSMVENIFVNTQAGASDILGDDWLLSYGAGDVGEDWNLIDPDVFEDWGNNIPSEANYDCELVQTNDGSTTILSGDELLVPYSNIGGAKLFAPAGFSSIYHKVRLSAKKVGETFQLKLIDIAGILTGRYES